MAKSPAKKKSTDSNASENNVYTKRKNVIQQPEPENFAHQTSHPEIDFVRNEKEASIKNLLPGIAQKKPQAIAEFFEIFSDDIYNFPLRMFRFNEDEAGEFYLYAFEHLRDGKKISSFQGKARFTTWFFAVLRNLTIDFIRSQKDKVKFTTYLKMDNSGKLVDAIETISDKEKANLYEDDLFESFNAALISLNLSQRVLFKLAYAWYFELIPEEIDYLCTLNKVQPEKIMSDIHKIKSLAHERSVEVRNFEERLSANFQSISAIESRIEIFFRENPDIERRRELWDESFYAPMIPPQIIDLIQSLMKKKKKQQSLLISQKKSLLSIRVPYKDLGKLLKSTQGVLSVQLIRIIEKLSQSIAQ